MWEGVTWPEPCLHVNTRLGHTDMNPATWGGGPTPLQKALAESPQKSKHIWPISEFTSKGLKEALR